MAGEGATRPRFAAFAPTECYTCLSRHRKCDKQRPYCSTCLDEGLKCGGYATALSWHECRAYSGKKSRWHDQQRPEQRSTPQRQEGRLDVSQPKSTAENARTFRFVGARSRRLRKTRQTPRLQEKDSLHTHQTEPLATPNQDLENEGDFSAMVDINSFLDNFHPDTNAESEPGDVAVELLPGPTTEQPWTSLEIEDYPVPDADSNLPANIHPEIAALPREPSVSSFSNLIFDQDGLLSFEWPSLGPEDGRAMLDTTFSLSNYLGGDQQQEILLKAYDTDLCVLPLTSDMALNPFRIRGFGLENSQLLLHSISALSSQHQLNIGNVESSEASQKRSQAYDMLNRALQAGQLSNRNSDLLAAILILMTLDCTISAQGNWSEHIRRAVTVFEAWGGPSALNTPRLRSQASMLVWWDATLAMISRQGTKLSSSYFQHLVRNEKTDGWSFYEVTGCPTELLTLLVQLAEMARAKEMAESSDFLTFDSKSALEIEKQLLDWKGGLADGPRNILEQITSLGAENHDGGSTHASEEENNEENYRRQQDDHHCAEAWRYALLLYIQRVFRWNRQSARRPPSILPLVCKILEHSRNCRKTSQVQKQLLLPIFLAGAEARDRDMQDTVRAYCLWWGARSRYGMFYSVSCLLEEYWARESCKDGDSVWWGSFLDAKSKSGNAGDLVAMQFLFG